MKKNYLYIYILLSLSMLLPCAGRFAYGLIMVLLLNLLIISGIGVKKLVELLKLESLGRIIVMIALLFITLLFKSFLRMISPAISLSIGYAIYFPCFSAYVIDFVCHGSEGGIVAEIKDKMFQSLFLSVYALVVFLVRDIFGYGTFTLPHVTGLAEFSIFAKSPYFMIGNFWASIPGVLVITSLFSFLIYFVVTKINIAGTSDVNVRGEDN